MPTESEKPKPIAGELEDMPVIDSMIFHDWAATADIGPYLSAGWRELLIRPTDPTGSSRVRSQPLYTHPTGGKLQSAYPKSGPPGSDFELLRSQVLGGGDRERAVLGYDEAILTTAFPNHHAACEVVRAVNDWTAEQWLSRDERLYGLLLAVTASPIEAAAEIRRAGRNERFVGVALGANALGCPFGESIYYPVYEAAAELGLPLVLQVGSDAAGSSATPPMGGGLASTYAEYRVHGAQSLMAHVASMIIQGVFDRFPTLRLLLVGGGVAWLPAYLWRLNYWFKMEQREAPWLKDLPSEYFARHVRLTTYTLEAPPRAEMLIKTLQTVPWIENALLYASGYPNDDGDEPAAIRKRLPEAWHARVFHQNAREFFRWPAETVQTHATTVAEGKS